MCWAGWDHGTDGESMGREELDFGERNSELRG